LSVAQSTFSSPRQGTFHKGAKVADQTPTVDPQGAKLEYLVPGAEVVGVVGALAVTVVQAEWHGQNFITLTYKDQAGMDGLS